MMTYVLRLMTFSQQVQRIFQKSTPWSQSQATSSKHPVGTRTNTWQDVRQKLRKRYFGSIPSRIT